MAGNLNERTSVVTIPRSGWKSLETACGGYEGGYEGSSVHMNTQAGSHTHICPHIHIYTVHVYNVLLEIYLSDMQYPRLSQSQSENQRKQNTVVLFTLGGHERTQS